MTHLISFLALTLSILRAFKDNMRILVRNRRSTDDVNVLMVLILIRDISVCRAAPPRACCAPEHAPGPLAGAAPCRGTCAAHTPGDITDC